MKSPHVLKFSSKRLKGLNKRVLEQSGDGPLEKFRRVLNEEVKVTSNNRGFRKKTHTVATYGQVKKGLSYFYPKRIVECDGILTQPPSLLDIHSFFKKCLVFVQIITL